jgi:hypothetical protein
MTTITACELDYYSPTASGPVASPSGGTFEISSNNIQSDQQESKSEQALQIISHVVAKSYAHKRSKHGRRQFMVLNAT